MKGCLLYRREDVTRNEAFIELLLTHGTEAGLDISVETYESFAMHMPEQPFLLSDGSRPEFLINRSCSPWVNEAAEYAGIRVFNESRAARTANDKRLSHALAAEAGMPMLPSTALHREALNYMTPSYPFVVKDPMGRGGTGVEWISRPQQLSAPHLPEEMLMQPVGGQRGKDLRVYIVGGNIAGAVLRESTSDFKANVSFGANARMYDLSEEEKAWITRLTDRLYLDFAGIDFLIAENGTLLFNEMEDAVGCRSLYQNSSIDIAELFIRHVAETVFR
ncbi:ATP-grasp domain-containing protein [Alkalicoccus urumqiensis]|uniref:ATP-grasp domain-containing protein n=1 Tax=Alkalicoccus urumqiensis TaxID=1548213 RepID=A0A2P6MF77_ALKUR|nr:hypothetical protein [Alkalicoccus urumqiensis]PRO64907.1 hypothetical protein C6I21_12240 [Alkalicoccus urumqiensis]